MEPTLTTLDVDFDLQPDVVGSIRQLPFKKAEYDVVASFQVLEHLPYKWFRSAISEMTRVTSMMVLLSLPDSTPAFSFSFHIPKLGNVKWMLELPLALEHKFDGQHYWEIGKRHYPLARIVQDIRSAGLRIENTYRVLERPYHRIFVLRKL